MPAHYLAHAPSLRSVNIRKTRSHINATFQEDVIMFSPSVEAYVVAFNESNLIIIISTSNKIKLVQAKQKKIEERNSQKCNFSFFHIFNWPLIRCL